MCYSAQIKADYQRFVRQYGARLSLNDFYDLFWRRLTDAKIQVPCGVEAAFASPQSDEERAIQQLIAQHAATHVQALRAEQDEQRERLAKAELKLEAKPTKTAAENRRIALKKIEALQQRIDALEHAQPSSDDVRIYPGSFVPVMVMEHGQRIFRPMRYHCRPWYVPATFDQQYPGCYNARRDSLKGFWRRLYGHCHGVVILSAFYERVLRHLAEGRPPYPGERLGKALVEFRPDPAQDLLAACIWSRWTAPGEPDLLSFAIITQDPPPEIQAVGHDRCIIPVQPEDLDAWLQPSPRDLAAQDAILDRHVEPHYGHSIVVEPGG